MTIADVRYFLTFSNSDAGVERGNLAEPVTAGPWDESINIMYSVLQGDGGEVIAVHDHATDEWEYNGKSYTDVTIHAEKAAGTAE